MMLEIYWGRRARIDRERWISCLGQSVVLESRPGLVVPAISLHYAEKSLEAGKGGNAVVLETLATASAIICDVAEASGTKDHEFAVEGAAGQRYKDAICSRIGNEIRARQP
jgi:hypothetical protein